MRYFRLFVVLALGLSLLSVATNAFARPVHFVPPAQATTTSGPQAPTLSDKMSTLQAMQNKGKGAHFIGTVAAFDSASLTLILRDGSVVILFMGKNTRTVAIGPEGGMPRPAELAVGQLVMVRASGKEDALTVRSILVMPTQPLRAHLIGTITEYTPGVSITIQTMDGESHTFVIGGNTNILPPQSVGALAVGSRVIIVAPRNAASGQAVALGIVVLP